MDRTSFQLAVEKILSREQENHSIGTLGEKTLHAVIKNYVEPDEDFHEVRLDGYVADVYRDGCVYEIQTANFNKMREKLCAFLPLYKVTIVYPVPATKWLRWIDVETGEVTERRKSPKKGTPQAVFKELYKIKPFLKNPNLSIRILLIDVEETRLLDGWSYDRKKGSHRDNRIPTDLVEDLLLEQVEDYRMLVPPELERFDSKEYAKATKLTVNRARTALNVLYDMGIVERVDKAGNRYLYEVRE
jgi:hypothetical protein